MSFIQSIKYTKEFFLDERLYTELERMFDKSASIKQCFSLIDRFILSDISVKGESVVLKRYILDHIIPFFKKLLREILLVGWAPYRLKKVTDKKTKETYMKPEIVPLEFVRPMLGVKKDEMEYEFVFLEQSSLNTHSINTKVFVYSDLHLLAKNNLIHSVTSGVLEEYKYSTLMRQFNIQAESVRCNPLIYLQKDTGRGTGNGNTDIPNVSITMGSGGNVLGQTVSGSLRDIVNFDYQKRADRFESASENILDNIVFHAEQMARSRWEIDSKDVTQQYRPQHWNNLFVCPPGLSLAAPPQLPNPRLDPSQIEHHINTNVYMSFGIPESIARGDSGSRRKGISGGSGASSSSSAPSTVNFMDIQAFEGTLNKYTVFFKNVFVTLYEEIFLQELNIDSVQINLPQHFQEFVKNILDPTNKDDKKKSDDGDSDSDSDDKKKSTDSDDKKKDTKKKSDDGDSDSDSDSDINQKKRKRKRDHKSDTKEKKKVKH